ncbi:MAG: FG-GAP repeat protein, partial [Desulfobulbaceae bacterium]|nr:FG-GAP repeat protein [Desulfobulbaceae bacterium]
EGRNTKNLVVELLLSGDLQPNLTANTLVLADSQGNSVVKYTGLHVFDSDSKALPSQLVLTGSTLRIFVDDKGARYPVTIDPWIQTAKLTADDGVTNDQFGNSIAISGDTIVVGAQSDNGNIGSAYVFVKPTTGWADMTQTAKLTADDGAADDQFGYSVAISGDTVVVSARGDDSYTGSAYVFVKPVTGWADMTQTAKLTASDGELSDNFGYFVAISGDTIVVGAQGDDGNAGSAYVFVKPDTGWDDMTQTAKLTAGDRVAGDRFGYSVAISNDTIVVGSIYNGLGGSAYVFVKPPGSGWADMPQTAKLSPDDGAATDYFSDSVAISNDTIIVGADGDDDNGTDSGSAYVFVKPVKGWADMTQTAKLTAGDGAEGDEFGLSVAISGNTIVATAFDDDDNGSNSGSAYVFTRPVTGWVDMTQTSKFTADDGAEGDEFGLSVAISGNTIVVGAWKDDGNIGSAYVFNIDRFPWTMFLPAITNKAKH